MGSKFLRLSILISSIIRQLFCIQNLSRSVVEIRLCDDRKASSECIVEPPILSAATPLVAETTISSSSTIAVKKFRIAPYTRDFPVPPSPPQ